MSNTTDPTETAPRELDPEQLTEVDGGAAAQTPAGMAPPKYSAGWWDLVRKSGVLK